MFGTVEFDEAAVFSFPAGMPGFEDERRFLPLECPAYQPLLFLQSLCRPELCFLTLPVLVIDPAYHLAVGEDDCHELGLPVERPPEIGRDVLCLALLTLPEGGAATANLFAPLVVNLETRAGAQILQYESGYSHQHPVTAAAGEACQENSLCL